MSSNANPLADVPTAQLALESDEFKRRAQAVYNASSVLRQEFGQFSTYLAFCRVKRELVTW